MRARRRSARPTSKTVTITTDGKLTKYEGMSDKPIYFDWLASDVFAMSTSPDDKDASAKLLSSGVTSIKALKNGARRDRQECERCGSSSTRSTTDRTASAR